MVAIPNCRWARGQFHEDRRDAQQPLPAGLLLRDRHRLDRRREVAPPTTSDSRSGRGSSIDQTRTSRSSDRRSQLLPWLAFTRCHASHSNAFGILERLRLAHALILLHGVDTRLDRNNPTPSLRAHYRRLDATTSRSALGPCFGTLDLAFLHLVFSLHITDPSSRSSTNAPGSSSRHLYAGHRPSSKQVLRWTSPG